MHLFHLISCHFVLSGYKKEKERNDVVSAEGWESNSWIFNRKKQAGKRSGGDSDSGPRSFFLCSRRAEIFFPSEQTWTERTKNMGRTLTSGWIDFVTVFSQTPAWNLISKRLLGLCSFSGFVSRPLYSWYEEVLQEEGSWEEHFLLFCPGDHFLLFLQNPSLLLS